MSKHQPTCKNHYWIVPTGPSRTYTPPKPFFPPPLLALYLIPPTPPHPIPLPPPPTHWPPTTDNRFTNSVLYVWECLTISACQTQASTNKTSSTCWIHNLNAFAKFEMLYNVLMMWREMQAQPSSPCPCRCHLLPCLVCDWHIREIVQHCLDAKEEWDFMKC